MACVKRKKKPVDHLCMCLMRGTHAMRETRYARGEVEGDGTISCWPEITILSGTSHSMSLDRQSGFRVRVRVRVRVRLGLRYGS